MNNFIAGILPNSGSKISIGQKLTPPKPLFDFRGFFKNLTCCNTLYSFNQLRHTIFGNRLNQKMNMIFIGSDFQKNHFIPIRDAQATFFKDNIHSLSEHRFSIFCWEH